MISHLALIMDGNRRWAKEQNLFAWQGHKQGAKNVEMVVEYCREKKIQYLSLYAFSLENLQRTADEKNHIFDLIKQSANRSQEFIKNNVQVRFVGNLSLLPEDVRTVCDRLMQDTKECKALICSFLVCYGGQQEIIAAIQKIITSQNQQGVDIFLNSELTKETLKQFLWMGNIPDPEIIIRTGGVKRLSNFLLFQAAYSEIRFLDVFWPALTKEILDQTIEECLLANKNFGK
jgi:undecaprenyl diphosphate synthase